MRLSPYAYFDSLFIVSAIQRVLGNAAVGEVHMFGYLACLLSLYRGKPASSWGYSFARTYDGAPYGADLMSCVEGQVTTGYLLDSGDRLTCTEAGTRMLAALNRLAANAERLPFLVGATSAILRIPVGTIRGAMLTEPGLSNASMVAAERLLLQGPSVEVLHGEFAALAKVLGTDAADLMVPSIVWLTFRSQANVDATNAGEEPADG